MSLTRNEIIDLLTVVVSYDSRTIGETTIASWADASELGRWTYAEAERAARDFLTARPDDWLKPGHVTALIRSQRQDFAMREAASERVEARDALAGPLAKALERGAGVGDPRHIGSRHLDGIYAEREWPRESREANLHQCPYCRAAIGEPCSVPSRKAEGGRTPLSGTHPSRTALTVPCGVCSAAIGELCVPANPPRPNEVLPHHERDQEALGETGRARRKAQALERLATRPTPLARPA